MSKKTKWIIGIILFICVLLAVVLRLAPMMYKAYLSIKGGKIHSVDLQMQMPGGEIAVDVNKQVPDEQRVCEAIPDTEPEAGTDFEITNCYYGNAAQPYGHACTAYTEQGARTCGRLCDKKVAIKESCSY